MMALGGPFRIQNGKVTMGAHLGADTWNLPELYRVESPVPRAKGQWSAGEDQMLNRAVSTLGAKNWTRVAALVDGRSSKQCRERWHNHLSPDIDKSEFTACEESIVRTQYQIMGPKWSEMSRMLPGRTDNSIKNLFNSRIRRDINTGEARSPVAAESVENKAKESPTHTKCNKRAVTKEPLKFDFGYDFEHTSFLGDEVQLGPLFSRPAITPRALNFGKEEPCDFDDLLDMDEWSTPPRKSIDEEMEELILPPSLECVTRGSIRFTTVPCGMVSKNTCSKSIGVRIKHDNVFSGSNNFGDINKMLQRPQAKRKRTFAFPAMP
jgi:hypothetical protein